MKIRRPLRFVVSLLLFLLLTALNFEERVRIDIRDGSMTLLRTRFWTLLNEGVSFPLEDVVKVDVVRTKMPIGIFRVRVRIFHRRGYVFMRECLAVPGFSAPLSEPLQSAAKGIGDFHCSFFNFGNGGFVVAPFFALLLFLSSIAEFKFVRVERF